MLGQAVVGVHAPISLVAAAGGSLGLVPPPQTSSGSLAPLSSCSKVASGLSQGSGHPPVALRS